MQVLSPRQQKLSGTKISFTMLVLQHSHPTYYFTGAHGWFYHSNRVLIGEIQSNHQMYDRQHYSDLRDKKKKIEDIQGQNAEQECIEI